VPAGDDEDAPTAGAAKRKGGAKGGATGAGGAGSSKKKAKTMMQRLNKFLFSWARTTHKVNGKKLLPHTQFLWRYMVRGQPGGGGDGGADAGVYPATGTAWRLHILMLTQNGLQQTQLVKPVCPGARHYLRHT
jgi:hypothetical protein